MRTCVPIMAYTCKAVPLQRILDLGRPYTETPNDPKKQFLLIVIINGGHKSFLRSKTSIGTFHRIYIIKPHDLRAQQSGPHQRALTDYERAACSLSYRPDARIAPLLHSFELNPLSQLFLLPYQSKIVLS